MNELWNSLPKEIKVGGYMFLAAILEQFSQVLNVEMLGFIPALYRVLVYNFVIVVIVEAVKRLKVLNGGRG